jgi:formylglycine-generating enzyme required for sulfatase activity
MFHRRASVSSSGRLVAVAISLLALPAAAFAAPEPAATVLILISETPCSVSVDGKGVADISADQPVRLELPAGEYVLSAVASDGRRWAKILRLEGPKTIVPIDFAAVGTPPPPAPKAALPAPAGAPPAGAPQGARSPDGELAWVLVAAGEFDMGCSPGDDQCNPAEPLSRRVRVAKPFEIMARPVTAGQFRSWASSAQRRFPTQPKWSGDDVPVVDVTWDDAVAFCSARAARLPTETEWEYAARAGTIGPRYGEIDAIAWYADNSGRRAHPVGLKLPNAFGLYDMLGNVWEWTADVFQSEFGTESGTPAGPDDPRSLRGGSWKNKARQIRVSNRGRLDPDDREDDDGFRCARDVAAR